MGNIRKLRFTLAAIILLAIGVGALWLLVPAPKGVETAVFYSPFGTPVTLIDLMIALGGSFLFLRALHNFKQELKPAYRFIAYAQLSVGLATMVFPYIEYYDLWTNVLLNMASYLSYLFGSVLMYFGMRRFYKILQIRGRVTSILLVAGIIVGVWVIHSFVPHAEWVGLNEHQYDAFELAVIIPVICYASAAYMAFKIRKQAGNEYRSSFGWLGTGLTLQLISAISIFVLDIIGYDNWYFNSRLYVIPTIAGDAGLLLAAFYFNAVGLGSSASGSWWRRLFGAPKPTNVSSLDIITYVVGMASDLSKVDPILDKMRILTAQLKPGQVLGDKEQQVLRDVYLGVEQYLVTSDPLRAYNRESLRTDILKRFNPESVDTTFWPLLPQATK